MKVLVDTDVLLDVALDRAPHASAAAALLDTLEQRPGSGFVAWHTLSNFYYLVRPKHGNKDAQQFVLELTRFLSVSPTDTESVRVAGSLDMRDFEDAMQVAAALACGADVIATRNTKDFRRSPVPGKSPEGLAS